MCVAVELIEKKTYSGSRVTSITTISVFQSLLKKALQVKNII